MTNNSPHLIGIHGHAGSGKDTVAQMLMPMGYEQFAFADNVREALIRLDPLLTTDTSLCHLVETMGWEQMKRHRIYGPEVRRLMQAMGTGVGQEMFGTRLWSHMLEEEIADTGGFGNGRRVVISDVLHIHEVEMIRRHHGVIWRVERPGVGPVNDHPSAQGLPADQIDHVILNNSDTRDLSVAVVNALTGDKSVGQTAKVA